jgi:hypothetical protein
MTTGIRLKYVHQWVDKRNGGAKARYYFRRSGFKRIALPGLPGSAEFMEAYQAALTGQALPRPMIGASRTKAGSLGALIVAYFSSPIFLSLKPATQQTYRLILEKFRATHGDKGGAPTIRRPELNPSKIDRRVFTPGPKTKSRNSRPRILSAVGRGSRSAYCFTRRSAAPMSCAWGGSTFAAIRSMCGNRKRGQCWPYPYTLP